MNGWKLTAIIFIILFIVENTFIYYGYSLVVKEEEQTRTCAYDICKENAQGLVEDQVCFCYDYDLFGNPFVNKTEVMK